MDGYREGINRFLVEVFHVILRAEAKEVERHFRDLSLRELHVIEVVCRAEETGGDDRATAIAKTQGITAGSLTTSVALLEKKGYLIRQRDGNDRRVVHILPTEKGRKANGRHAAFHERMVDYILQALTKEQADIFMDALGAVAEFFLQANRSPSPASEADETQTEKET